MSSDESEEPPAVAGLSHRQYECLVRAGEGMSSKEIGRALGISPSTVDNHIHAAILKLQAKNRWQAAQLVRPTHIQNGSFRPLASPTVPPWGGRENTASTRKRLFQIVAIGVLSVIVLTSASVVIMGAVDVFGLG